MSEPEQSLLRHLAVFVSGVTVDGAVAVMRDNGASEASVTESLANLVEKSLALRDLSMAGARWRLLGGRRFAAAALGRGHSPL